MPIGEPGRIADCGFKNTLSPVCLQEIPPAVGVVKPLGLDYRIALPSNNQSAAALSADLVTGNVINISVSGNAITPVNFATSHLATMNAIATAVASLPNVASATVGGANNRTLTILGDAGFNPTITSFIITGGASQAIPTITVGQSGTFFGVTQSIYNMVNAYLPVTGVNPAISSAPGGLYYTGQVAPTLTQGRIYVVPETLVTSNSPVYMRIAPNGANTQLGAFRGDADGGTAVLVSATYALWREGNPVLGEVAVLELNIP